MTRPRIAIVAGSEAWAGRLRALAQAGLVRISDLGPTVGALSTQAEESDLLLVGAGIDDIGPSDLRRLAVEGCQVVFVVDDPPASAPRASATAVRAATLAGPDPVPALLDLIDGPRHRPAPIVRVTGAFGAPGRTEIALAIARQVAGVVIGGDGRADLGARTGAGPRPRVAQVAAAVRLGVRPEAASPRGWGGVRIVSGFAPDGHAEPVDVADVAAAWSLDGRIVVVDGPPVTGAATAAGEVTVLVVDPSPVGITRAALLVHLWEGRPPHVVVNRCTGDEDVRTVRRWLGLEPWATVDEDAAIRHASMRSRPSPITLPPLPELSPTHPEPARVALG